MKFMVIVKASKDSEAGVTPSTELLTPMSTFNEKMAKAGVMKAGEGLHPTSKGARLKYSGGKSTVARGPFNFTSDLVCGFWLIETKSLDEAIDWIDFIACWQLARINRLKRPVTAVLLGNLPRLANRQLDGRIGPRRSGLHPRGQQRDVVGRQLRRAAWHLEVGVGMGD